MFEILYFLLIRDYELIYFYAFVHIRKLFCKILLNFTIGSVENPMLASLHMLIAMYVNIALN